MPYDRVEWSPWKHFSFEWLDSFVQQCHIAPNYTTYVTISCQIPLCSHKKVNSSNLYSPPLSERTYFNFWSIWFSNNHCKPILKDNKDFVIGSHKIDPHNWGIIINKCDRVWDITKQLMWTHGHKQLKEQIKGFQFSCCVSEATCMFVVLGMHKIDGRNRWVGECNQYWIDVWC